MGAALGPAPFGARRTFPNSSKTQIRVAGLQSLTHQDRTILRKIAI